MTVNEQFECLAMTKKIALSIFIGCGPRDPRSAIWPIGNGLFELRCFAGVVEFAPDLTAQPLPALLATLERSGIQGVRIESELGAQTKENT